jgi:hypothetical protein
MTTPYSTIIKKFEDNLAESDVSKIELFSKRQFLRNAISTYIGTIGTITADNYEQVVVEDLSEIELLLLSLLMYDSYFEQEIIKYNKVINISNEFIKISGASLRVKTLRDMKAENQAKINNILSSLI